MSICKRYSETVATSAIGANTKLCMEINKILNLDSEMRKVNIFDLDNELVQKIMELEKYMTNINIFQEIDVLKYDENSRFVKLMYPLKNEEIKVVVKRICYDDYYCFYLENIFREVAIHSKLKHPNIISLLDFFIDTKSNTFYIVTELAKEGSLYPIKPMAPEKIIDYYFQILDAIEYCHYNGLIHGDIKPENIVLSGDGIIKLIDFGGASYISDNNFYAGTLDYSTPEFISNTNKISTIYSDLWALGVLLYELFCFVPPFESECIFETKRKIINVEYTMPDNLPLNVQNVIRGLLVKNERDRLPIEKIREMLGLVGW